MGNMGKMRMTMRKVIAQTAEKASEKASEKGIGRAANNVRFLLLCLLLLFSTACTDSRKSDGAYQGYMAELNRIIASAQFSKDVGAESFAGEKSNQIVIMKPGSEITDEITITGPINCVDPLEGHPQIQTCAKLFVEAHPHVKIILDNYEYESDYGEAFPVLLMTENFGDIVIQPNRMRAAYLQESKFLDLARYVEDSETFNPEEYYTNIIEAEKTKDGKLLVFPTSFYSNSEFIFLGSLSEEFARRFEDDPDLTMKDVLAFYAEKKQEMGPGWKMKFYEYFSPIELIEYNFDMLVDFENKEVHFTDPEFMKWMEMAKNEVYVDQYEYTDEGLQYLNFFYGTIKSLATITDSESMIMLDEVNHEKMELMPLRTKVRTKPRTLANFSGNVPFKGLLRLSIGRKAKNPDLAWEFIRFYIGEKEIELPDSSDPRTYIHRLDEYEELLGIYTPINKANHRTALRVELDFMSEIKRYRRSYEHHLDCSWNEFRESVTDFYTSSAEKMNVSTMWFGDYFQPYERGIIWDEMYLYLSDLQSVEETMRNIENKIKIMLNE